MPADGRSLRQKLEDMANQTDSPHEAEIARAVLAARFPTSHVPGETGRVLSRAAILGTPDRQSLGGTLRLQTKDGTWYTVDVDEMELRISLDKLWPS